MRSQHFHGIWQIHPFREGNTRTTALFAIKYLRTKGFSVTNDLFARESWYFRNALVRANYENTQQGVVKTTAYLEDFLRVLLYGETIELRNRFLRIGFEYGSPQAEAIAPLHRRGDNTGDNAADNRGDNLAANLPDEQRRIYGMIRENPKLSIRALAERLGVRRNTIDKQVTALKAKGALVREGGTRGVWKPLW